MAFDRCENCGSLDYLHNGLCNECASHISATTHGGDIFGSDFNLRPTCPNCGGTGEITHFFGEPTKCPSCHGTGKQ